MPRCGLANLITLTPPPSAIFILSDGDISTALEEFIGELKRKPGEALIEVVLFGSRAKGTADEESDVDVLVVHSYPEPGKASSLVAEAALETSLKFNVPSEPVAMAVHESGQKSFLMLEIEGTGGVLYNADPASEAEELAKGYAYLAGRWLEHAVKEVPPNHYSIYGLGGLKPASCRPKATSMPYCPASRAGSSVFEPPHRSAGLGGSTNGECDPPTLEPPSIHWSRAPRGREWRAFKSSRWGKTDSRTSSIRS